MNVNITNKKLPGLYFNTQLEEIKTKYAGLRKNTIVIVKLSDGKNIIPETITKKQKKFLNHNSKNISFMGHNKNYGDLVGLHIAIKYALKNNIKNITGFNETVIKYWANKMFKKNIEEKIKDKIFLVSKNKNKLEANGGNIFLYKKK